MLTKTYIHGCTTDSVSFERTPSRFALDSLFYVQEIGRSDCCDTYYTEHENIHSFLLMLTEHGTGRLCTTDGQYTMQPGDLVFADCMQWHSYGPVGHNGWETAWLYFSGRCAKGYYDRFARLGAPVVPAADCDISSDFSQLIRINSTPMPNAELCSSDLIVHILTKILISADAGAETREPMPAFVEETLREINTNLCGNLTLDHFARTIGVDKYHLQKEFKRHVGMTPNEYVCAARIKAAKSLLLSPELTVSQVSEKAGFGSTGHFMNMFKRATGLTPGEYRRRGISRTAQFPD